MTRGLAFLSDGRPLGALGYGTRLARLRWMRAAGADATRVADWRPEDRAEQALAAADRWVFIPDASALPLPPVEGTVSHTLRELETAAGADPGPGSVPGSFPRSPAAFAFCPADLPASEGETIKSYFQRLLTRNPPLYVPIPAFVVGDGSETERPEVVDRLPQGAARILDLGCGAGGLGLARPRRPGWRLTGIERDSVRAARARSRGGYERVLEGDLSWVLPELAAEGSRFDAFVFADVLEHLEEPAAALAAARELASPGAGLLAVVPNVGHLSVVRDLLLGRHDPVPAGLCDAGHLRWFTKDFLAETIAEAGWTVATIDGLPGAPPPDPGPFRGLAEDWPEADPESLDTYQWIATAHAR